MAEIKETPITDAFALICADTGHALEHARQLERKLANQTPPLGYVLVELDRINHLTTRLKDLAAAGSRDAKSLAADAALLLEANRG